MSDLTCTNEETLIELLRSLKPDHYLMLLPALTWRKTPMGIIDVFEVPLGVGFNYLRAVEREEYHKCSLMAIALHADVWEAQGDAARKYR